MFLFKLFIFMLSVLFCCATCEPKNETQPSTKSLIHKFETDATSSRTQQEYDRNQMRSWADAFQVQRLEACVQYRLQMIKHQEHNFKSDRNSKWNDCLYAHRNDTRQAATQYYSSEQQCLRQAASEDTEQRENVELWEKQIAHWRKGYRYIINLCRDENPENKRSAEQCVVNYMQNDKFDELIHRLLQLKQVAMSSLQDYYRSSQTSLESCLKTCLSEYLDRVRAIMSVLNKCYSIT